MKIIIPMSGLGKRFAMCSYIKPKPLLLVDGKPIIEYVVSMFPGNHEFVFICNTVHLATTNMREILLRLKPAAKIIAIEPHHFGPVYAISQAFGEIKDDEDVMVSYCDYFMHWDFAKFIEEVNANNYDGAVHCYTGFHPHLIIPKLYAGVIVDKNQLMLDIKEKHSFTANAMEGYHSAGAFYFRRGSQLKKYFKELMDKNINLQGEFYVSMVYYLYLRDKLKVFVPLVERFMQWGTPEDFEEYEFWSRYFAKKLGQVKLPTDIPPQREANVAVPYQAGSKEFIAAEKYWGQYFIK